MKKKISVLAGTIVLAAACTEIDTIPEPAQKMDSRVNTIQEMPPTRAEEGVRAEDYRVSAPLGIEEPENAGAPAADEVGKGETNEAAASQSGIEKVGTEERAAATQREPSRLEAFIGYEVMTEEGQRIGTVEAFWEDKNGEPYFMAIAAAEGAQQLKIVPAEGARISTSRQVIRLPYSEAAIQEGPSLAAEAELDFQTERQIAMHYALEQTLPETETGQAQASQGAARETARGRPAQSRQGGEQSQPGNIEVRDEATIRLFEEEVDVGTRKVNAGGIRLRKVVRTEIVNKPVKVRHEELIIERVPATGEPVQGSGDIRVDGNEIFVPLRREAVVIEKEPVLREIIQVDKETEANRTNVTEQIREEELRVIREEGTDVELRPERE